MAKIPELVSGVAACYKGLERSPLLAEIGEKNKVHIETFPGGLSELKWDRNLEKFLHDYGGFLKPGLFTPRPLFYVLTGFMTDRYYSEAVQRVTEMLNEQRINYRTVDDAALGCWAQTFSMNLSSYSFYHYLDCK